MRGRVWVLAVAVAAATVLSGCGDGEDRPGQVTETGTGTGTGTATGTGSATGTGGGEHEHGGTGQAAFPKSEADADVHVTLVDFQFKGLPETIKGPKVFFEARNEGPSQHELVVFDEDGSELGAIPPIEPGPELHSLAVELKPGRYRVECRVMAGDRTHAELGMRSEITVE